MTKSDTSKLDALFQQIGLEHARHRSILSGKKAVVIHHFIGRRNMATRWYLPNGIPLTHEEHMFLHSQEQEKTENEIRKVLGEDWYFDLRAVSNRVAKYFTFEDVLAHFRGEKKSYIPTWYT